MNIKDLYLFISVYEYRSISKAAEKLYMTQPALTRAIKNIEREMGLQLFRRTNDGIIPTEAGNMYLESAKKIINIYHKLEISLSTISNDNKGCIIVGTNFFLGSQVLPLILPKYQNMYKNTKIHIVEGISSEIENEIIKGSIDIGIVHMPINSKFPSLNYINLCQDSFLISLPENDALSHKAYFKNDEKLAYLDINLLKSRNFILNYPNQRARQEAERICKSAGFSPNIKYQTRNIQTIVNLVASGCGVSILPASYIKNFKRKTQPIYYNIEGKYNPNWTIALVYSNNLIATPATTYFIEICKKSIGQIEKMN